MNDCDIIKTDQIAVTHWLKRSYVPGGVYSHRRRAGSYQPYINWLYNYTVTIIMDGLNHTFQHLALMLLSCGQPVKLTSVRVTIQNNQDFYL